MALDQALQFVKLQSYILDLDSMYQCEDNSQPRYEDEHLEKENTLRYYIETETSINCHSMLIFK